MTGPEVNAILIQVAELRATVVARLDNLTADNQRGDQIHADHEARIRTLEASNNEGRGVWKLLTAGGALGALVVGLCAVALRSVGA